ncbi:MAG: transcriptional regulator [Acidobacteria bacterium RIFCSPLOWO2_12_FULL_59_11]|nr:MAG: transcriptional regulator [Acidobacteria bacterium RIFCSPLOWO2_12_FULL_59_11]
METMLRCPAVVAAMGDARSTVYARIAERLFVSPVRIGRRSVAWPASEVEAINAARIAGKTDTEIRALVMKLEAARKAA